MEYKHQPGSLFIQSKLVLPLKFKQQLFHAEVAKYHWKSEQSRKFHSISLAFRMVLLLSDPKYKTHNVAS